MDGMLSQDEINALLNGVDLSADSGHRILRQRHRVLRLMEILPK